MTVAASTAKVLVNASGWNSFPSWPVSANTGMNANRMMAIEKNTGRPTSRVDSEHRIPYRGTIAKIDAAPLDIPEGVLRDDDPGVDQHADGDGDARQAHDVGRDAGVVHAEEREEHGERQRQRDDENGSDVHQKDDVGERDEGNLSSRSVVRSVSTACAISVERS